MRHTKRSNGLKSSKFQRSDCPIACALDVIGDKWSLLIIRDILFGKSRFSEFMDTAEGMKSNILADRLKRLERARLISKSPYQDHPPRYEYELTPAGKELGPILRELVRWSNRNIPGTRKVFKPG